MRSVFILTALVASALAGPTGYRQSCSQHCSKDNVFSYQTGRSYEYEYTATTTTAILGDSEGAVLSLTAHAHIDVNAPCEYTLRLTDVTLAGSSHAEEMAAALTRSALRFSFQDGRVEELCATPSEETWVLNVKRGVLSAFQTSIITPGTQDIQEKDVQGVCLTSYRNKLEGDVLEVFKTKDLKSCSQRADLVSHLTSASYNTDSRVQSLPLLDSTSHCNQKLEGGILIEASCKEQHTFRPFSGEDGGASTEATTNLKLVSRDAPAVTAGEQQLVKKSPVFEGEASGASQNSQAEAVTAILTQLEESSHNEVRPETPALFSRLVLALRDLEYPVLSQVYTATSNTHSRRFLVDAMPLVGTASAAAVVRDMYANGDLSQEEVDAWFTSLTFLKNPTSDIFTAIAPMLENNPSQSALLGTSALVNTFCKTHSSCGEDSGVQQVMRRVEAQLGSGCRATNEEQKIKILVALRALGNAGRWVNANRVLQRCYTENNDMEIRVAAIEAWRHTPCEYDRSHLLAAFQDQTQDSEVRIAAYLSLMTCPTPTVVATVKDRLTSEGVNHVGSFVWTHLSNLQESAAPGKEWTRELLGEEMLVNKFNTEALRFSRNYESSFFTNTLNLGAAVESNVIFSSKSYLPRSAMVNLTLDLFGESVNLFEVGGRIEGFESYLERLFGPDGYFPEETVAAALKGLRQQQRESETTTLEQFLEEATDEPHGSYYFRLFGNDVYYRHFRGLSGSTPTSQSPLALLLELARGGNVDYTKSYQLLDAHHAVPTVTGLPLTLSAKSTATLSLKMDGSFKANSLSDLNIQGHLRPSAAVQVEGVMVVDAHVTRAGVRVSSTMHTATSLEGKVHISGGALVDVAIDTPKERTEFINVDTKYFYVKDDHDEEIATNEPVSGSCALGSLGVQVCTEVSMPTSSCLALPNTVRVYLQKTDTQTGYNFRLTKSSNEISLLFDNPGAQHSHRVAATAQLQENKIHMKLDSFLASVEANGEYEWQQQKKGVKANVKVGQKQFQLDAGLLTPAGDATVIEPYFVLLKDTAEIANAKAVALASPREGKYSVEVLFNYLYLTRPFNLKATIEGETGRKNLDIAASSPFFDVALNGKLVQDASSIRTDLTLESTENERTYRIASDLLLQKQQNGDATTYSSKLTSTFSPDESTMVADYVFTVSPTQMNTKIHFTFKDIDLLAEETWSHTLENGVRKIHGVISSKSEYYSVDSFNEVEITIASDSFLLNSAFKSRRGRHEGAGNFLVEFKHQPSTALTARIEFNSGIEFKANAELKKIKSGHYSAQVYSAMTELINLSSSKGEMMPLIDGNVSFKDDSQPGTVNMKAEGSLSLIGNRITLNSKVYGDRQSAKVNLQTQINEKEHGMKIEVTPTSLVIDANIVKHVVVNAKINPNGPEKTLLANVEWDKETNPNNAFKIEGKIEPSAITAEFRFMEKRFSASGRLVPEGVEAEAEWSPDQRVGASVRYSLAPAASLAVVVDTTFPGWEKQTLELTASLQSTEASCRASATWKNDQHGTLAITGRLQPGGNMHAEAVFTSTVSDLKRLSLTLDHQMSGITIVSGLQGSWNDHEVNGSLHVMPTETGLEGLASFTSPLTKPFKAILTHHLRDTSLDSKLITTYDNTQLLQFAITGTLNLTPGHYNVDTSLKLNTALESLPDADATLKYTLEGSTVSLLLEGKAGPYKIMLTANGEKIVTPDSTNISGDLRFLTPFTQPLTASLSHTHDGSRFTSQFEITRIWSTYSFGSIKMHADGHILSKNDISFSAYISSPETKGSFSFNHKIENNSLTTVANMYANKELISVTVTGTLDLDARLLNLEGEISSSFEELEMKVNVNSKQEGNTQNTRVDLIRGTNSAFITHIFTATDALNWENLLTFNNQLSLKNKMARKGEEYQHEAEMTWGEQRLALDAHLMPVLTATSRKVDAHFGLTTPWQYLENTKLDLHYEQEVGGETKVTAELEYAPASRIILFTRNNYNHEGTFFSTASLSTPFWQTLGYSLNLNMRPENNAILVLTYGEETTVRIASDYSHNKAAGDFRLSTPSLQYPLHLEASYDATTPTASATVAATYHHKYEVKGTFSGSLVNAAFEIGLQEYIQETDSWRAVNTLGTRWQHQLQATPFNVDATLRLQSKIYQVSATLDQTSFRSNFVLDGREGSLALSWLLQPTNTDLRLVFQSPVQIIKDFNMEVAYDVAAMRGEAKMKYDTQEIELLAKMEDKTFVFEGKTPFSGWEILGASFFASTTAINAHVLRNDRKIELTGTQHLRPAKGKVELVLTTPYHGLETISFDASYNFLSDNKSLKFKALYGTAEIFAKGTVKLANPQTPKVILNITTPFSELRTLRASTEWSLSGIPKTAAAKVIYNEQEFTWNLKASNEGTTQRLTSTATTPFPGWRQASIQASISASQSPYEVRITIEQEGVTKDFSGRLMLKSNTIQGEIKTPIPGWEVVALDGTYTREHESLSTAISATHGNNKYEMDVDVSFDTLNPRLKVEVVTPFTQVANLQLIAMSSFSGPQKTVRIAFSKNDMTFSADATFKIENKAGFLLLSLRSPLSGFTTLEVEGMYDLQNDIKKTELNVTKEGEKQYYAVAATLNDNHVVLDVATPFPGFQVMKMDADYTSTNSLQHLLVATFVRESKTYEFRGSVEVRDTSVEVRLNTPIPAISQVLVDAQYQMVSGATQASIRLEKNGEVFELRTQHHFTPLSSSFSATAVTPVSGWNNMAIELQYKVESNKLAVEARLQRNDFHKEVTVKASYGPERGILIVRTPLPGWETLGIEYVLTMAGSREATALVKVTHNNREFAFSASGHYTQERIALQFRTPFQGYEESSLEATIDVTARSIKGSLQVGPHNFSAKTSYVIGNLFLEVKTPFPILRIGSIAVKHTVSPGSLQASINLIHNKNNYFIVSEATVGSRTSLLVLQTKTPILELPSATLKLQYNLDNKAKLITGELTVGDRSYGLIIAGDLQEKVANIKLEMITPFSGWSQLKFESKLDLTQDEKTFEMVVEREGNMKAINIHGKFVGYDLNFDLSTPFTGLNRLNVSGNLNRAKRSLELQMMNDAGDVSLLASFNCVKLKLKTPFARMEELSFEMKKEGNTYEGMWKRNDNYLTVVMTSNPRRHTVNLEVKSELQGWEFLALAGRLDEQTEEAYASGQINERKVELQISGSRNDRRRTRNYLLDLKTPYANYKHVTGELAFSPRQKTIKVQSNSSRFNIEMTAIRGSKLQLNVFVPNPTQNTELKAELAMEKGTIDFSSRFSLLRSLNYHYDLKMGEEFILTQKLNVNGLEMFTMEFKAMPITNTLHIDIHGRLENRHTNLHIHREGFKVFNVILKRETTNSGRITEHQVSMEMTGTGSLPAKGNIQATFYNSFVAEPRTTTINIDIDRTSTPKHLNIKMVLPGQKLYMLDAKYNINLNQPTSGDFEVSITTPDRRAAPWNNMAGKWDVEDSKQTRFEFEIGGRTYMAEGTLGLLDTNLVFSAENVPQKIFLQWRFIRMGPQRDYYIKVGPESAYRMLKLKGNFNGMQDGNVEGGFKFAFQPDEFLFNASWKCNENGTFEGQGGFTHGRSRGTYSLVFHRDAANKSATFNLSIKSNNQMYQNVVLKGNYDVLNKLVFNAELKVNNRENRINIDISNLNPRRSRNSVEAVLHFLPPQFQVFHMTLTHDFRNNNNKYIKAEAILGDQQSYLKANWKRSDDFKVLEGKLDISSIFIGEVHAGINYDMSDFNNANAEVHYKRIVAGEPLKQIDAKWSRKMTRNRFESELTLDSTFERLQHARAYATADFSKLFNLNAGLVANDTRITIVLNMTSDTVDLNITTPFEGFENIKGTINYSLGGKTQKVTLHYERGSRQAHIEILLNRTHRKKGNLKLEMTTPFEFVRILKLLANWDRRHATVNYVRNDVHVTMTGKAKLDTNKSEFNLSFTAPGGKAVTIAAAYDVKDFIANRGSSPAKLALFEINIDDIEARFVMMGFRNSERLYLELDGKTSLMKLHKIHFKLDSELNMHQREGTFELKLNDFVFIVNNKFERYVDEDGYYFRSRVESSLTPLPALVFGLGRRGSERIFTLGYGEDKEVTFSIKGKNNFRDGFTGSVDIPNFGYDGVQYDVTYGFPSNDELKIKIEAELGRNEHLEGEFEYNSNGVKARLMSPFTGEHSARVRRSITADSFFTEAGVDDYNFKLSGNLKDGDITRGIKMEADILGRPFLFNYQLQSDGVKHTEGKLVLQTPFRGWEKIGGMFTYSHTNTRVEARAEAFIPFFLNIPRVTAAIDLEYTDKITGEAKLNVSGEQFIVRANIAGASLDQGLEGYVTLQTPFLALPSLEVAGKLKMPSIKNMEADLKITDIYTTYEVDLTYEVTPSQIKVDATLLPGHLIGNKISILLEGLSATQNKLEVRVDNDYLIAEYTMAAPTTFTLSVDTHLAGMQRQLSIDTRYSSLDNLQGTMIIVLGEEHHKVHAALSIVASRVTGNVVLDSSFIGGVRKLDFDTTMPNKSLEQVSFNVSVTATQVHSFSLELDTRTSVLATIKIDTPALQHTTIDLQLTWARVAFTVTTPSATHKATLSWRQTRKMPADTIVNAELDTPLLGRRYALGLVVGGSRSKAVAKAELEVGSITHRLEASTFMTATAGGFNLNVETPFMDLQKVTLQGSMDMSEVVEIKAEASIAQVTNSFNFVYNANKGTLVTEAASPYIPTGMLKATAEITKDATSQIIQLALMNTQDVISGRIDLNMLSDRDITIRATISTPLEVLKTANAVIKYQHTDVTLITFSLDHPITFRAAANFANTENKITSNLTIKTSIANFEYINADIEIPLKEFAPRATLTLPNNKYGLEAQYGSRGPVSSAGATLFLDDQSYGANYSLRTKAPYELAYEYHILEMSNAFHLRTDSSFFTWLL